MAQINTNKFAGLSRDWVGSKILFMCLFFRVILMGEQKHINKVSPPKSRDNPVKILFTFFIFMCFFRHRKIAHCQKSAPKKVFFFTARLCRGCHANKKNLKSWLSGFIATDFRRHPRSNETSVQMGIEL